MGREIPAVDEAQEDPNVIVLFYSSQPIHPYLFGVQAPLINAKGGRGDMYVIVYWVNNTQDNEQHYRYVLSSISAVHLKHLNPPSSYRLNLSDF
jgi:hypothetical protein